MVQRTVVKGKRGFTVHLSTTDPAAHIAEAVAGETLENLSASRIDPAVETAKYHREVTRQSNQMPAAVEQLLPRLRDPDFTRVLIVTLPEATPVHEAASLQRDLRRAEIEPYAWVINQCLAPLSIHDPLLQERQRHEQPFIREVMELQSQRTILIAWQIEPPVGKIGLEHLLQNNDLSTERV